MPLSTVRVSNLSLFLLNCHQNYSSLLSWSGFHWIIHRIDDSCEKVMSDLLFQDSRRPGCEQVNLLRRNIFVSYLILKNIGLGGWKVFIFLIGLWLRCAFDIFAMKKKHFKIYIHYLFSEGSLIVFTRGQFWPSGIVIACICVFVRVCECVYQSVCQSLACPCDNSGPVQGRIAKFGPKMQKTLVKVPIVLGGNWHWPSRSNLT